VRAYLAKMSRFTFIVEDYRPGTLSLNGVEVIPGGDYLLFYGNLTHQ
jgi:hypothetical protein